MPLRKTALVLMVLTAAAGACWLSSDENAAVYEPVIAKIEPASPCPWRDADTQLTNWFPDATGYAAVDVILSGQRSSLEKELGRAMRPEEMALHVYVVKRDRSEIGKVLAQRIKAKHGAVEIALAIERVKGSDCIERIRKMKIQSIREPEETISQLRRLNLENCLEDHLISDELPLVAKSRSNDGEILASQIMEEVRTLLVLYRASERAHSAHH